MNRTPIQQHTSALIKGLIAEAKALKNLDNPTLKGQLREAFVSRILRRFLTSQFGIGTGAIINQKGEQSRQIDIIIYDKRILPPFIQEERIGVYPAECVMAVIEVKSWVYKKTVKECSELARELYHEIYNPLSSMPRYRPMIRVPWYSLTGFYHRRIFRDESDEEIINWMVDNAKPLFGVCIVNKLSWLNVMIEKTKGRGSFKMVDKSNNEETKAFIAVLLDNVRTLSQIKYLTLTQYIKHADWLGIYTRDQTGIKDFFEKQEKKC